MLWDSDNKLVLAVVAGSFAIVGTLVTAIVSIKNSIESTNTALELNTKSAREARFAPFYEKQLILSLEASRVVATLATTDDPDTFKKARARFLELYFGELAVVEQATSDVGIDSVEAKMVRFLYAMEQEQAPGGLPRQDLEVPSLELAKSIRRQTAANWDVSLGPLGNKQIDPQTAPR